MRSCLRCRVTKEDGDFYASRPTVCKPCVCAEVRTNRANKHEYYRAYDMARYRESETRRAHSLASFKKAMEANPSRRRVAIAVNNAVRDGRLTPQPCWVCGRKAEAHHADYDRPLDVVWLCRSHHMQAHAVTRQGRAAA